jgi:hypothetical protein
VVVGWWVGGLKKGNKKGEDWGLYREVGLGGAVKLGHDEREKW